MKHFSVFASLLFVATFAAHTDQTFDDLFIAKKYKEAIEYVEKSIPENNRDGELLAKLGYAYEKTGETTTATKIYRQAEKKDPKQPLIYSGLGRYNFSLGKFQSALESFQKAYIMDRTAEAAEGIAICAAKLGQWEKAQDAAESAVKLDSTMLESRIILAKIFMGNKHYESAAKHLVEIVKQMPSSVKYHKQLAECYEKTGNNTGLASIDERIVKLDKNNIASRKRLAAHYAETNKNKEALEINKELAILTPKDPKIFRSLYELSIANKDKDAAVANLKKYLALKPDDASLQKALGHMLYERKDIDGALEAYRAAVKTDPAITGLYDNYVRIVVTKKLDHEAIPVITKAITAKEANAYAYVSLADIYKRQGKCSSAITMYQEALKLDVKDVDVLVSMGECQVKAGDAKNAIVTFEQVVLMKPAAVKEYRTLGDLQLELGKTDNAVAAYKKYLERTKDDNKPAKAVGIYEYEKGQYKDAIKYLEMVKNTKYHDVAYLKALGLSYFKTENYKKAASSLAALKKANPPASVLKEILKPLAESYEWSGNNQAAAAGYEAYEALEGVKDADAAYRSALLREKSDIEKAKKLYAANTQAFPKDHRNFVRLGMIYADSTLTLGSAASMLEKSAALVDTIPTVWEKLGGIYGKLKKDSKELAAYQKLLKAQPNHTEANARVGLLLMKMEQASTAIPHLEKALAAQPKDMTIRMTLAQAYSETKAHDKAAEVLEKAIDQKPGDAGLQLALVEALDAAGKGSKADQERKTLAELDEKAVSKNPKDLKAIMRLANYYLNIKKFTQAYTYFTKAAVLSPKDKDVHIKLYKIAMELGKKSDAITHLKAFLALDSNNASLYKTLGDLQYDQKEFDGAIASYRRAHRLDPKLKGFFKKYEKIAFQKKLYDEAINVVKAAVSAGEADAQSHEAIGDIYATRKDYPNAIESYQQALKTDMKNMQVLKKLADCQAKKGETQNAIITYEQVVMMDSKAVEEYKTLGDLKIKAKNENGAMESYKKYLEKDAGDEGIARTVGLSEHKNKQYYAAIKYLEMVKKNDLKNTEYFTSLGEAYYQTKDYKNAAACFDIVRKGKVSASYLKRVLLPLAVSQEQLNDKIAAAKAYHSYATLAGVSDEEAAFKGAYLRQDKDKATALKIYEANTKTFPKDARNYYGAGLIYLDAKGGAPQAVALLKRASELSPDKPEVWGNLAKAYGKIGQTSAELAAYEKLLAKQPQNTLANRRVGEILMSKKKYAQAIANLEIALTAAPKDEAILLLLADGYLKTDRIPQTVQMLARAKEQRKTDTKLRMQLYELYKQVNAYDRAENEIKELIAMEKDNKYRVMYANDLIEQKRYDDALRLAKEIKAADPMSTDGLMLLGTAQRLKGMYDEAIETFKMVMFVKDNFAPALYERGLVYMKQEQLDDAKSYLEKAIKADGRHALAEFNLAHVCKKQGDMPGYNRHLKRAAILDPKHKKINEEAQQAGVK